MSGTLKHLLDNVVPAASDYAAAENELSTAYGKNAATQHWEKEANKAKRRAAELAIAIDGLTDRSAAEWSLTKNVIRGLVDPLCIWPGPDAVHRQGALDVNDHQKTTFSGDR